jgi:hypothetical protein
MARAEILAGICGFKTHVEACMEGEACALSIESDCGNVLKLAEELRRVDPIQEITYLNDGPATLRLAKECSFHTACPVPNGIIKAVEVEAGLALPADASITVSR